MRSLLTTILVLGALVGIGVAPAAAQDGSRPMPPRMELGGNFTLLGQYGVSGGPQFTLNFNRRHAIRVNADFAMDRGSNGWNRGAFYGVQYRYTLPVSTARTQVSLTAGGLGIFEWSHQDAYSYTSPAYTYTVLGESFTVPSRTYDYPAYTDFNAMPPLLPTGGIAVQHVVGHGVVISTDVSLVAGLYSYVGVRATAGVVVPLGRARR